MKKNIIWKGIEYKSLENLTAGNRPKGFEFTSVIVGSYQKKIYICRYEIKLNKDWEVIKFRIVSVVNGKQKAFEGKNIKGKWEINGKYNRKYDNFKFIDISVSPITNTLPINNLDFVKNQPQQIEVIYLDILNSRIKPVKQIYTQLSKKSFKYQNLAKDFEAKLKVDKDGFTVNYPKLFKKVAES